MIIEKYYEMMVKEISELKEPDIRQFGLDLLQTIPEYFFSIPASSTGKYHPVTDLGEGGLVRHSIGVKKMLTHLLEPEGYWEFSPREKELLMLAALFHDCMKSGTEEEYKKNPHTKFLHPILAANHIMFIAARQSFDFDSALFIATAIVSHMGQWNEGKYDKGTLPKPKTDAQKILHLADYLGSRSDINVVFQQVDESIVGKIEDHGN